MKMKTAANTLADSKAKGILRMAIPLMLTAASGTFMVFVDRAVLAHYSLDAMNAGTLAGMGFSIFQYAGIGLAAICEIFVGQENGAGNYKALGTPVWQMLYFALFSILFYWPIGLFGGSFLLPEAYFDISLPIFKIFLFFGPLSPAVTAVAAFFIAQGYVKFVTYSFLLCNLINFGLDVLFVFGIPNVWEGFGMQGAAIATGISQCTNFFILFLRFLSPHHRTTHGTNRYQFNFSLLCAELKLGFPQAFGRMIEISGWTYTMHLLAKIGAAHLMVGSFGQSLWVFFLFISEGLQKAVIAIASNLIGAQKNEQLPMLLKNSCMVTLMVFALLGLIVFLFPNLFIQAYFSHHVDDMTVVLVKAIYWIMVGLTLEAILWCVCGILTACGDTRFIMLLGTASTWTFGVLPCYLFVYLMGGTPLLTIQLWAGWGAISLLFFYARYHHLISQKKFYKIHFTA